MKKNVSVFAVLVFLVFGAWSACEAGGAKVAVLPFKINSAQNMDFLRNGIQDMLSSRLSWEDKVLVVDKEAVNRAAQSVTGFEGRNKALLIGAKLAADYVVYGSLTMIGENTSIDAKVIDIEGKNEPTTIFTQTETIGQVIPEINRFATEINTKVFKRPLAPEFGTTEVAQQNSQSAAVPNQNFISSGQPMYQPSQGPGAASFWKSRMIDHMIVGMDYGDVNTDGNLDVVWVSTHGVHVAQIVDGRLGKVDLVYENSINSFVGVDVGDINGNGVPEIFVSSLVADKDRVSSFVLEFNGSEYKEILDGSEWIYRIVRPSSGKTVLLGQEADSKKGGGGIWARPVSILTYSGHEYLPESVLLEPDKVNVLGIAIDDLEGNGENTTIAFSSKDYLTLYNSPRRSTWQGADKLGGNMSRFLVQPKDPTYEPQPQYFPMRVRTFDTDGNGSIEVITAANHDVTMNLVSKFRSFSKTHVEVLQWNSLGLQSLWQSQKLSGRISDLFVADYDNDGVMELVISLVTSDRGLLMSSKGESVIVAYDLIPQK